MVNNFRFANYKRCFGYGDEDFKENRKNINCNIQIIAKDVSSDFE